MSGGLALQLLLASPAACQSWLALSLWLPRSDGHYDGTARKALPCHAHPDRWHERRWRSWATESLRRRIDAAFAIRDRWQRFRARLLPLRVLRERVGGETFRLCFLFHFGSLFAARWINSSLRHSWNIALRNFFTT